MSSVLPSLAFSSTTNSQHRRLRIPHGELSVFLSTHPYPLTLHQDIKGDRICIFGFSRGAYTARALAGMLHKVSSPCNVTRRTDSSDPTNNNYQVGLLPACNPQQIPFAYKMYTRADDIGWEQSTAFKRTFSVDVDIEFIGVWYVRFLILSSPSAYTGNT
jgi:Uncharacterized alpha/beta hydrolase domain (DUF2235)